MNSHTEHTTAGAELWGDPALPQPRFQLTAILDPVLWPELDRLLEREKAEWAFLCAQSVSGEAAPVLPRCVRLQPKTALADAVLGRLHGCRGILVRTALGRDASALGAVVAGLSPMTHAVLPDGDSVWFRFYDAPLLGDYLTVADECQKAALYGAHVESFWRGTPRPGQYRAFLRPPGLRPPVRPPHAVRITPEQMEAMGELRFQRFLDELADALAQEPGLPAGADLRQQVERAAARAEGLGLAGSANIAAYVKIEARCGWNAPLTPQQRELATLPGLTEAQRLARITGFAAERAD